MLAIQSVKSSRYRAKRPEWLTQAPTETDIGSQWGYVDNFIVSTFYIYNPLIAVSFEFLVMEVAKIIAHIL